MYNFKFIFFIIFLLNIYKSKCSISDKRFCVDKDCTEPISHAKTLLRYSSPDSQILSFLPNQKITVFSKEAGSRQDLWGVEINGKRGYVPKHLVRETKVLAKPTIIVDTTISKTPKVVTNTPKNDVDPDKVKKPFEVVDGTTIFLDPSSINPSSTEIPVLSTATTIGNPENQQSRDTETNTETIDITEEKPTESDKNPTESEEKPLAGTAGSVVEEEKPTGSDENPTESEGKPLAGTEGSVVGDVFSSLKNWINEDESEEDEGEEDMEDDEDEEEFEEDEEMNELIVDTPVIKSDSLKKEDEGAEKEDEKEKPKEMKNEEISKKSVGNDIKEILATLADPSNIETIHESLKTKESNDKGTEKQFDATTQSTLDIDEALPMIPDEVTPDPIQKLQFKATTLPPVIESFIDPLSKDKSANVSDSVPTKPIHDPLSEEKPVMVTESAINKPTDDPQNEDKPTNVTDSVTFKPTDDPLNEDKPASVSDSSTVKPEDEDLTVLETSQEKKNEEAAEIVNSFLDNTKTSEYNSKEVKAKSVEVSKNQENLASSPPTDDKSPPLESNWFNIDKIKITPEINIFGNGKEAGPNEEKNDTSLKTAENAENPQISADISMDATISDNSNEVEPVSIENPQISVGVSIDTPSPDKLNEVEPSLAESQDELIEKVVLKEEEGIFAGLYSLFDSWNNKEVPVHEHISTPISNEQQIFNQETEITQEPMPEQAALSEEGNTTVSLFSYDLLLYLGTTAIACTIFLAVYMLVDKTSRETPLIQRINKLEKELIITRKEKEMLQEAGPPEDALLSTTSNEELHLLKQRLQEATITIQTLETQILALQKEVEDKYELEEQIESLEKELETSTEVGMELNRIISEMLDPTNGSEKLKENVEQLQRQLLEQKGIINDITKSLNEKKAENEELKEKLDASKCKTNELQSKLDEIVDQILRIEKERDQQQRSLQEEISLYQQKFGEETVKKEMLSNEIQVLKSQLLDAQRKAELKIKEYQTLKDSLNVIKSIKNDKEALQSLLNTTSIKAELEQLKVDNERYAAHLEQEEAAKAAFEKKCQAMMEENNSLLTKYQECEKEKVEATMKLGVLNNYFKKREEELQSDILKYKSIWDAKEGEATSTTERIKLMAEEIENYKSQNVTLKQEIVSQEIDLKSQISMLEKKVHENWVASRQMERKLEDARHEAAQLRNRLTLRERAIVDERTQNRLQSPLDQNGELTLSPPPIESPASPPMLFSGRDHITKSPPLPGLPPFLPPPLGGPFMPPPPGMPFMPPPPAMFPGDHRPPPLGRMSSPPPLNSRYSPDTSAFSPYERNTPSPPYDSEYGASPTPLRGYSPYSRDDRRDYKRPATSHVSNGRNNKGSLVSSGSDHSNDSLGKMNRKHSKMV